MTYVIEFRPAALRNLEAFPVDLQKRISKKINSLADNPRPPGVEKLAGPEDLYRVRVGDYRIIYTIRDELLLVIILKVGHRREVYR